VGFPAWPDMGAEILSGLRPDMVAGMSGQTEKTDQLFFPRLGLANVEPGFALNLLGGHHSPWPPQAHWCFTGPQAHWVALAGSLRTGVDGAWPGCGRKGVLG
jgi:hypothetical protein